MSPMAFVYLAAVLFSIGAATVMLRRNAIIAFMAFARLHGTIDGQIMAFFVMVIAAAEVVVGLAIIIALFRARQTISLDEPAELKG